MQNLGDNPSDRPNSHGVPGVDALSSPLLVLEGALFPPGAAVVADGRIEAIEVLAGRRGAGSDLVDAARLVLERSGNRVQDLGGIVVGAGPGSFTGLRVALSAARGFRYGHQSALPLAGFDSPCVLAACAEAALPVRTAVPWGRLRVLLAQATADGALARPGDLIQVSDLPARSELVGERIVVPSQALDLPWPEGVKLVEAKCAPVEGLARLAGELLGAEAGSRRGSVQGADPVYLVPPDAVLPARLERLPEGREVVPLTREDLEGVLQLEQASFPAPWSEEMLLDELEEGPARCALGIRRQAGGLEAAALARWDDQVLEIISVAVDPPARRGGLGRILVRRLVGKAREEGCARIDLEVSSSNVSAIALYASEGFVPVGQRRNYYPDGSDALLMSLMLRR